MIRVRPLRCYFFEADFFRELERPLDFLLLDFLLLDLRLADFLLLDVRREDFELDERFLLLLDLRAEDFFLADFFDGTLAPASRASDSPIAIACFLLFTVLPERPLFNVPRLRLCMAFFTDLPAFLPYFAIALSCKNRR